MTILSEAMGTALAKSSDRGLAGGFLWVTLSSIMYGAVTYFLNIALAGGSSHAHPLSYSGLEAACGALGPLLVLAVEALRRFRIAPVDAMHEVRLYVGSPCLRELRRRVGEVFRMSAFHFATMGHRHEGPSEGGWPLILYVDGLSVHQVTFMWGARRNLRVAFLAPGTPLRLEKLWRRGGVWYAYASSVEQGSRTVRGVCSSPARPGGEAEARQLFLTGLRRDCQTSLRAAAQAGCIGAMWELVERVPGLAGPSYAAAAARAGHVRGLARLAAAFGGTSTQLVAAAQGGDHDSMVTLARRAWETHREDAFLWLVRAGATGSPEAGVMVHLSGLASPIGMDSLAGLCDTGLGQAVACRVQ